MPVLAIVGQKPRDALGGHYQREVDLVSLFKDVAGAFVQQASSPAQVRHLIDRAIRMHLAIGASRLSCSQTIYRKRRTATRLANMELCARV
jgi:pyruvate dehydrogenase (quinone)